MVEYSRGAWFDPLNKMIWKKALKERATEITLRHGEKFILSYSKHDNNKVFVKPAPDSGALTPCGWFNIEKETAATYE